MGSVIAAFIVAYSISAGFGRPVIAMLKRLGARQTVSADAPGRHAQKQGTPTMGGVLILAGLTFPVVAEALLHRWHMTAMALLGLTLSFGAIGFLDDLLIARRGKNLGLKARHKLLLQFLFAILFVCWLKGAASPGEYSLTTSVRLSQLWAVDLGNWYYVLGVLFIVGFSNAVNLMDGLDGLAGGVCTILALALTGLCVASEWSGWIPLFGFALAGACAGFLWHNSHPAQIFMGDTGSLALGAALAGMALIGKAEGAIQLCAIVPWAELGAVIIQVSVFKIRKKRRGLEYAQTHRVFKRTPLHHHYEELNWPETQIVTRFWLVTAFCTATAFAIMRWYY